MFIAAAAAILTALALVLVRAIRGPSVFDRVLAGNSVGVLAILLLAVIGFLTGRPAFLDIALTYGLLNLIGTLAVLKFFRHGDLASGRVEEHVGPAVEDDVGGVRGVPLREEALPAGEQVVRLVG